MISGPSSTSPSLIAGLAEGPANPTVWAEFVRVYFPLVLRWCREHGLQPADAADVARAKVQRMIRAAVDRLEAGGGRA